MWTFDDIGKSNPRKKKLVPNVADGGECGAFDVNFKFNCTIKFLKLQ